MPQVPGVSGARASHSHASMFRLRVESERSTRGLYAAAPRRAGIATSLAGRPARAANAARPGATARPRPSRQGRPGRASLRSAADPVRAVAERGAAHGPPRVRQVDPGNGGGGASGSHASMFRPRVESERSTRGLYAAAPRRAGIATRLAAPPGSGHECCTSRRHHPTEASPPSGGTGGAPTIRQPKPRQHVQTSRRVGALNAGSVRCGAQMGRYCYRPLGPPFSGRECCTSRRHRPAAAEGAQPAPPGTAASPAPAESAKPNQPPGFSRPARCSD
jgi:hypothetical protein